MMEQAFRSTGRPAQDRVCAVVEDDARCLALRSYERRGCGVWISAHRRAADSVPKQLRSASVMHSLGDGLTIVHQVESRWEGRRRMSSEMVPASTYVSWGNIVAVGNRHAACPTQLLPNARNRVRTGAF
jgi:hypothetical protein